MMQLRQQFVYYRKVMFLHMSVCSQEGGLPTDGGFAYRRVTAYRKGGCLPTEGEGVHLWGLDRPLPQTRKLGFMLPNGMLSYCN